MLSELTRLDRKIATAFRIHSPKADTEWLNLPETQASKGHVQLENYYEISTAEIRKYLIHNKETLM